MKLKYDSNTATAFAVCYIMFFEYVNYFVHAVLKLIGLTLGYVTPALVGLVVALLVYLLVQQQSISLPTLILPAIVLILYLLSIFKNEIGAEYIQSTVFEKLFIYCIPTYIAVRLIKDYKAFYNVLEIFSLGILLTQTLAIYCMTYLPEKFIETDYQGISYGLLIPFILFVAKEKYNGKIIALIGFTGLLLVFFGGRGPILCAMICVLYRLLIDSKQKVFWMFFVLIFGAVFLFVYDELLEWVIRISNEYSFAGSIAKYAEMGDVFTLSGRDDIIIYARAMLKDFPLGKGLGSTRYYLGVYGFKFGNYPHNIFYEFWCDYGFPIGTLLIALLIIEMTKCFFRRGVNKYATVLFEICFFSTGFLILTFSSSYLFCPLFFAMLAIMQNIAYERKQKIKE